MSIWLGNCETIVRPQLSHPGRANGVLEKARGVSDLQAKVGSYRSEGAGPASHFLNAPNYIWHVEFL